MSIGDVSVVLRSGALLEVREKGELVGALDVTTFDLPTNEPERISSVLQTPEYVFCLPVFGITFIGTSHGFDGHGLTTGFILWIESRGVLVDPPIGTNAFLRANRIPPSCIRDVILTHVHADHDAGLLPVIHAHPVRLTVHSFRTVVEAYLRKLRAKGVSRPEHLFDFHPVMAGRQEKISGARWNFEFSFHALPTLRFKVRYGGRCIAYSCDTFFEPARLKELAATGLFTPKRLDMLLNWVMTPEVDLIVHEAGVPPIHTPLSALAALPLDIRRRMRVVHCSGLSDEAESAGLQIPKTGLEYSLVMDVGRLQQGKALSAHMMQLLMSSMYFSGLTAASAQLLLNQAEIRAFPAGALLIREGDAHDDRVFLLVEGLAVVSHSKSSTEHTHVAEGVVMGEPGFPDWPPSVPFSEDVNFSTAKPFCGSNLDGVLSLQERLLSVVMPGQVIGVSRLMESKQPARNANVSATTEWCVCMVWDGQEVIKALSLSPGKKQHVLEIADSFLQFKPFLEKSIPKSNLFRHLPPHLIEPISGYIENVATYAKGAVICHEGELSRGLHCIRSGRVGISVAEAYGSKLHVAIMGEGHFFGENSMFSQVRRATVVVLDDDTTLLTINIFKMSLLMTVPAMRLALDRKACANLTILPEFLKIARESE